MRSPNGWSARVFYSLYEQHPLAAIALCLLLVVIVCGFLYYMKRQETPTWTPHVPYEPPRFEDRGSP